ncbi:MAG: DUF523 domain-containing protein [Mariprofundaceae bacterium]|nr:DUF523 domain-containing protein [Mariprofundaceae bacterium]
MSRKILISACLLGDPVRYDGHSKPVHHPVLETWQQQGRLLACCPEMLGGLGVPRLPAEIQGDGVVNIQGKDVTQAFKQGAGLVWALCQEYAISMAIFKEGSPSCGVTQVNDGTFQGRKIQGQGVTSQCLILHGIRVFHEHQWEEAYRFDCALEKLDSVKVNDIVRRVLPSCL